MEIRRLNLKAFGPFTDQILEFDHEPAGLHIVYGSNEAGKSSALRGLRALLFNIALRTPDNFIHTNDKLRVEGCLRASDVKELSFVRRKGRKNTLLSMEGEPLDDNALIPFLHGATPELFDMLFGLDHRSLLQGGQEILEQKGEVGQALFSASLGNQALHDVLNQLDQEIAGLFLPQGSKPLINSSLKDYAALNKKIRDHSLSTTKWDEQFRARNKTSQDLNEIQTELANSRGEINRLKRIQRSLPKLANRQEILKKLEALGDVLALPEDFGERRQKAIKERETAQAIILKSKSRLEMLQKQFNELILRPVVVAQSESIEALHTRMGGYRKAMQDRPKLEAEYKQLRTDILSLLKDVRTDLAFEDIEVLRPVFAKRQKITELGNKNPVLAMQEKQAKTKSHETEIRLVDTRKAHKKLLGTGSPTNLRKTVIAARKMGDVDNTIQANRSELASLTEDCGSDLARLRLLTGSLGDIPDLPVPIRESINRFEELFGELDKRTHRLKEKLEETADASSEASQRLDEMQRAGTVPTEEELAQIRIKRQQLWQLLRRQWIEGENVTSEATSLDAQRALPEAFEHRVTGADELVDRLRREAERVHSQANLLSELESAKRSTTTIEQQLDECAAEQEQIDTDWQELWAPSSVHPHSPREMQVWLTNFEKLRDQVGELRKLRRQTDDLEQSRDSQVQQLKQQLQILKKDCTNSNCLEVILLDSEEVVAELAKTDQLREKLDTEIKKLEHDQESVQLECQETSGELDGWKVQWKELIEDVGLESETSPSEAADAIDKLRDLFTHQSNAEKLQIRIEAIDIDTNSFSTQVDTVVAKVAPELVKLSKEEAVMQLNTALSDSRSAESQSQQIEDQLQQAQQDIKDSEASIQSMADILDKLSAEANKDNHADLDEAERKSLEYLRLTAEVDSIEKYILDSGEGATVRESELEAQSIDSDALPARMEALTQIIEEELEPRRTMLIEAKGRQALELELMDGNDQAAVLADQSQSVLASIRTNAERFVRLKLATRILRDEIERYRKENQGPLLKRASECFSALTCGSFLSLRTDFNEKDEPVLLGIRANGDSVHVEGMSNGTRDQLYLALRLASLEKYMENSEPMPFILDDILVDFDDNRSEAALIALAELARKTQIILFTHHSQIVEQALNLKAEHGVHIHNL